MPINFPQVQAGVISEIADAGPDPVKAVGQALKLRDLMTEGQINKLALKNAQRQTEDTELVRKTLKGRDLTSSQGLTEAASALTQAGQPDAAMKLMALHQQVQSGELDKKRFQLEQQAALQNKLAMGVDRAVAVVEDFKARNPKLATPEMLDYLSAKTMNETGRQLASDEPDLAPYVNKFISDRRNLTWAGLQQADKQTNVGQKHFKDQLEALNITSEIKHRGVEERQRQEEIDLKKQKAPPGYQWNADHSDLIPIPGGPKDPAAQKPWTGREKVFGERVMTSANEAAQALANITELPLGATTGVLGVGSSPGHSVLAAGRDALRNTMSDQDTQSYNTMLAGVRRNLATIETTGLAPQGSLTESFSSVELRPGDTQVTVLRKLAEARQIIDRGLDIQLADPAVPKELKAVMTKALDTVHKAVPFTQHDVTMLERKQRTKPDMTMEDLIDREKLRSPSDDSGWGKAKVVE